MLRFLWGGRMAIVENNLVWEILEGVEIVDRDGQPVLDLDGEPTYDPDPEGRGDRGDLYVTIAVDGQMTAHVLINPPFAKTKVDTAVRAAIIAKREGGTSLEEIMKTVDRDIRKI